MDSHKNSNLVQSFIPLSNILIEPRPQASIVSWEDSQTYSQNIFQSHIAHFSKEIESYPRGRWILRFDSTYWFGVALLSVWAKGDVAVLPATQQPGGIKDITNNINGLITDRPEGAGIPTLSPKSKNLKELPPLTFRKSPLNTTETRLELFTSGSTGERKCVFKNIGQLESEIRVLEKVFGNKISDCKIHSTVSHQHIYGLLFRFLWPLCAGRPFASQSFLFWDQFASELSDPSPFCLVSSPAHLGRDNAWDQAHIPSSKVKAVFSSGGPLRPSASLEWRKKLGHAPIEVFGSTETGGVAWKQVENGNAMDRWTPFDNVTVEIKSDEFNRLEIKSPFVSSENGRFLMGDRGHRYDDGRFALQGRCDRIVKISEKRVSLDDMETKMGGHAWVQRTILVLIENQSDHSRPTLSAAVCLNTEGTIALKKWGSNHVINSIRDFLKAEFDFSTLPRSFRFIHEFPMDTQGKVSQSAITGLFKNSFPKTNPELINESKEPFKLFQRMRVPPELIYFTGHFPGHPVVPGVVQIDWVVDAIQNWQGNSPIIRSIENLKFKNILKPGTEFDLEIEKTPNGPLTNFRFSIKNATHLFSSGRLGL